MSGTTATPKPVTGQRMLPKSFSPSVKEVIIGRGRKVSNHSGNERFRKLIYSEIREYSQAENKTAKSSIIFRVLQEIKNGSPLAGGFVKQDNKTKRWFAVEDATARTTTAQAFRDALSSSYKSSKQFKQQRRWDRKSYDSSTPTHVPATGQVQILPKLPVLAPAPQPSGNVAILPKPPASFNAAFSSFGLPSLARRVTPQGHAGAGSQLSSILNSALETASEVGPFPVHSNSMPPLVPTPSLPAITHPLTCGEKKCTNEVDLDSLWDSLGPNATSENPFEPTPLSPAPTTLFGTCRPQASPVAPTEAPSMPSQLELNNGATTEEEPKEDKDHCGACWETKIQDQIRDNSFWQMDGSGEQVGGGFSLRQALSCRHA